MEDTRIFCFACCLDGGRRRGQRRGGESWWGQDQRWQKGLAFAVIIPLHC